MTTKIKKILIIDDDIFFKSMYSKELEAAGFTVLTAEDGKDGLAKIQSEMPDFVILDLVMPKMDGWQVLEEVKKNPIISKIPILVLTGVASEEECKRAENGGALRCVSKLTVLPEAVVNTVSEYLISQETTWVEKLRESEIGEGRRLNLIFRESGEKVAEVLEKLLRTPVELGTLKATATSAEEVRNYLNDGKKEKEEEIMFYSVMKPPIGAIILMIKSGLLANLSSAVQSAQGLRESDQEIDKSILDEVFNIFANVFLSVVTNELKSKKSFMINIPKMSTADMTTTFLENDGFVFNSNTVQFIFRQDYNISNLKDKIFRLELIFMLSRDGLDELGGGD